MGQHETSSGNRLGQIIDAAYRCMARDGYAGASIKDIAREAGVAPSLLHYYFESKEQLLLAVVREVASRYRGEFLEQLRQDPDKDPASSIRWIESKLREDPTWFVLLFELYAVSLRDELVRMEMQTMLREERGRLAEGISAMLRAQPEKTGLTPEALAGLTLAVADGVILHALVDQSVDPAKYLSVLAKSMAALLST